ncbi:MAG: fibro-slime domain-containing protein, partial [Chitinivibrionales bacterium]|nr:fibro-slime domain-containing protein [Chitinivibrionales bacterium]
RQPDPYDDHNYGFTMEFHAYFTYVEGADQTFTFRGDDDVWVFINDSLIIDIAGVHNAISDSVNLDDIAPGFLEDGETYIFDFFFAERHTSKSRCYITTSIPILEPERTKIVKAKIRDFKEQNTVDTIGTHPDFNEYTCGPTYGMVVDTIYEGIQNSPFPGDHRQVTLRQSAQCATTTSNFAQWYNDIPGVNRPFYIDIRFDEVPGEPGVYGISFPAFFPIDNDSDWVPAYPGGPDPYGHLQTDLPDHNYGFTTEIHTQITYLEGTGQFFVFRGDDDVWAFVNDSLVMDLGGVHSAISDTIWLDSLPDGFLRNGHVYPFDFFHAERYIPDSRVTIKTSFQLDTYVFEGIATIVQFSNFEDYSDADTIENYFKSSQTLYIQVYDDSKLKEVDTVEIEMSGPGGEVETVQLIEAGTGTYRGSIDYGDQSARVPHNDLFDAGLGDEISFSFLGVGQEDLDPYTGSTLLTDKAAEIYFNNSSSYSDDNSLDDYRKRSDSLFIEILDDSKSDNVDETTIELSGPGGEAETVTLVEISPSVYRGVIAYGDPSTRDANDNLLNIGPGDEITFSYDDINGTTISETATLQGQKASVDFYNTAQYSNERIGGVYGRYNDTLYIEITDDSKTTGTDEVTITITGPDGEEETVTLTETEPGIYRGFIPFGTTDNRTADNGELEVDIGDTYTYTYDGIGESQPTTSTSQFPGALGQVYFSNTGDFSEQSTLADFEKYSDTLHIRVYDDDQTSGTDTVTITLSGPSGEEEVVSLVEVSPGVYEGAIPWGNSTTRESDNGTYDLSINEQFRYKYDPVGEPAGDIVFAILKGLETPVKNGIAFRRIVKFQALSTSRGALFTIPVDGILSLYSPDGKIISRQHMPKNTVYRVPSTFAGKMILYHWESAERVKKGKMLLLK